MGYSKEAMDDLVDSDESGLAFRDGADLIVAVVILLCSVFLFSIIYCSANWILLRFSQSYCKMSEDAKDETVGTITSCFEKAIVFSIALYNTVTIKSWSGELFGSLVSNITLCKPELNYVVVMMVSMGYLIFDEFRIRFLVADMKANKMTAQMSLHHYLVALYFISTLLVGYGAPAIASIGLTCEISTLFLNIRLLYPKKKGCFYMVI